MDASKISKELSLQLCHLLDQSVDKIVHCLDQISEEQLWRRPDAELNSIGNLLLHVNGNLRQWSVNLLSRQSDDRNRVSEFSTIHKFSKETLIEMTQANVSEAQAAISNVSKRQLLETVTVQGFSVSVLLALLHTSAHFQGHTHQIILLTRLFKKGEYKFHWSPEMKRGNLPM